MATVGVNNEPLFDVDIFAFDGDDYRVVKCDTDGQILAALATGSTIEVTQDTAADLLATVDIAADQTIEATQDTADDLRATAYNTPRVPPSATRLFDVTSFLTVPNTQYCDFLSGTVGAGLVNLTGRTVASDKTLYLAMFDVSLGAAAATSWMFVAYDTTIVFWKPFVTANAIWTFPVPYEITGDGSKAYKIGVLNSTGAQVVYYFNAAIWEE